MENENENNVSDNESTKSTKSTKNSETPVYDGPCLYCGQAPASPESSYGNCADCMM